MSERTKLNQLIVPALVGASVAGLFGQVSSCSRQRFERDQTILQTRLTAFQNYSHAYSTGVAQIYQRILVMRRGRISYLALNGKYDDAFNKVVQQITNDLDESTIRENAANAEVSNQATIIDSLFGTSLKPLRFVAGANDPDLLNVLNVKKTEYGHLLENGIADKRKQLEQLQKDYEENLRLMKPKLAIGDN